MKGNLLKLIRGRRSQQEMADKYTVSQQTWSSWESGRTLPAHDILLRMEVDSGVPMEVIFFESFNYGNQLFVLPSMKIDMRENEIGACCKKKYVQQIK